MFKSFTRIISILLIAGLNWSGLSAVFGTYAMFSDSEISSGNAFTAGTLQVLVNGSAFSPAITTLGGHSDSSLPIQNNGTLPMLYHIAVEEADGNMCPMLQLSGDINSGGFSTPVAIGSFISPDTLIASLATDTWVLRATLKPGLKIGSADEKTCVLTLAIDAWQDNLAQGQGFSDHKEIVMTPITGSNFVPDAPPFGSGCTHNPNIIINEFLPNPAGGDTALMPGGEWVELYNAETRAIDLSGWMLYTSDDNSGLAITSANTNSHSTIIMPHGFLVVYRNGDANFDIKNSGAEAIRLFDRPLAEGVEDIDGAFYEAEAPEGKSFARIPDGFGPWIDPIPTPGEINELSEAELKSLSPELAAQIEDALAATNQPLAAETAPIINKETPENLQTTTLDSQIASLGVGSNSPESAESTAKEFASKDTNETEPVVIGSAVEAVNTQNETPAIATSVPEPTSPAAVENTAASGSGSDGEPKI